MRDTDIRAREAEVAFENVVLDRPLVIAGRSIGSCTLAVVRVAVTCRDGRRAVGRGATMLSVPWAWPRSDLSVGRRDAMLRELTCDLAAAATRLGSGDPLRLWRELVRQLAASAERVGTRSAAGEPIPSLAALLCLGAVDNALHDAWACAARLPAHAMYTARFLSGDLADLLGPGYAGVHPGAFLGPTRSELPVQHVVGVGDPLRPAVAGGASSDGPPAGGPPAGPSLAEAVAVEGIRHVKVKVRGEDPPADAEHLVEVYRVAAEAARVPVSLALDPNEAYRSTADLLELLDAVRRSCPPARRALTYVEQPFPRSAAIDAGELRELRQRIPVVADESIDSLDRIRQLPGSGWSGLAVKAAKGQTPALLAHTVARRNGLFLTIQDLTAVDLALHHSARLASILTPSVPHLEYNSRQYAPAANRRLRESLPDLVTVRRGGIVLAEPHRPGLY